MDVKTADSAVWRLLYLSTGTFPPMQERTTLEGSQRGFKFNRTGKISCVFFTLDKNNNLKRNSGDSVTKIHVTVSYQ